MPQLKRYVFSVFQRDEAPIVNGSNRWGAHGEYVIDEETIGYTNWMTSGDEPQLQSAIPNGEDVVLSVNANVSVLLDMDVVAYSV